MKAAHREGARWATFSARRLDLLGADDRLGLLLLFVLATLEVCEDSLRELGQIGLTGLGQKTG